jgi:hypothetical protein
MVQFAPPPFNSHPLPRAALSWVFTLVFFFVPVILSAEVRDLLS